MFEILLFGTGLTRLLEAHIFCACGSVEEPLFCSKFSPMAKIWSKKQEKYRSAEGEAHGVMDDCVSPSSIRYAILPEAESIHGVLQHMAARDIFHNAGKAALHKDGWTIYP